MTARTVRGGFPRVLFAWLALAAAALPCPGAERSVEIWVGESTSIHADRKQIDRDSVKATSDDEEVAKASWGKGDTGPVTITGVSEGEALVTVTGKVRVVPMDLRGRGRRRAVVEGETFTDYVNVKVVDSEVERRVIMLRKRQKWSWKLGKGAKIHSITNGNPAVVRINKNTLSSFTIIAREIGFSLVTVKFTRIEEGKEKRVTGLVYVTVLGGRRQGPLIIKKGWDAWPEPKYKIIIISQKVSQVPTWPGMEGVACTFVPSGRNYGDIGDLVVTNTTDEPVTVTVPPGMLLESLVPSVQDLYLAYVFTKTPCEGAKYIGKPTTVDARTSYAMEHMCGFCPDHEKDPPTGGDCAVYACKKPDEKSKPLLATIDAVNQFDVGKMKLKAFQQDQTREMLTQGALWMVDSRLDEVKGNELTAATLKERYWKTFVTSAAAKLEKMSAEKRKEAEEIVQGDLGEIVATTWFLAKAQTAAKK